MIAVDTVPHVAAHAANTLQPSDYINAINALFAMVSAIAAVIAVRLAVREGSRSRADRKTEGRRDTYRRVVLDPLLKALSDFTIAVSQRLEQHRKKLTDVHQELLREDSLRAICKEFVGDFNERFFRAQVSVRQATIAWNDPELSSHVSERMQAVQDEVVDEIYRLATKQPPPATKLTSTLGEGIARVMQDLVAYDPQERPSEKRALKPT